MTRPEINSLYLLTHSTARTNHQKQDMNVPVFPVNPSKKEFQPDIILVCQIHHASQQVNVHENQDGNSIS